MLRPESGRYPVCVEKFLKACQTPCLCYTGLLMFNTGQHCFVFIKSAIKISRFGDYIREQ